MSWTYDPSLADDTDQVRFLIQDTVSTRPIFQDEELDWLLTQEANVYMAAAAALEVRIRKSGGVKSRTAGDVSVDYMTPDEMRLLADRLRRRGLSYQEVYVGGISVMDKKAQEQDDDWVQPAFKRGMHDNRAAIATPTQPTTSGPQP